MKRAAAVIIGLALIAGAARSSGAAPAWTFRVDDGVRIPSGTSTEVARPNGGGPFVQLAYVATPAGLVAYRSTDPNRDATYAPVSAQLPPGGEPAVVPVSGGGLRMYYVASTARSGATEIDSATSSDGLSWTVEPGTRLVIDTPAAAVAPEAVVLPNGGVRLYFVTGSGPESIDSAVSADGLSFTAELGHRLTGGYVDPAVLTRSTYDGDWLMVVSRAAVDRQRLFRARSSDGLGWTVDPTPIVDPGPGAAAFDPTVLGAGFSFGGGSTLFTYLYYSLAAAGRQSSGPYPVVSGYLSEPTGSGGMRGKAVPRFRLAVVVKGKGTVNGSAISCPGRCGASATLGAGVHLTAMPAKGYRLFSWGGTCKGTRLTCGFALRADASVRATFVKRRSD